MCAGAGRTAVGVDGKDVGGATEGADGHPAAVLAETHVLDLDGDVTGSDVTGQRVQHMNQYETINDFCIYYCNIIVYILYWLSNLR